MADPGWFRDMLLRTLNVILDDLTELLRDSTEHYRHLEEVAEEAETLERARDHIMRMINESRMVSRELMRRQGMQIVQHQVQPEPEPEPESQPRPRHQVRARYTRFSRHQIRVIYLDGNYDI